MNHWHALRFLIAGIVTSIALATVPVAAQTPPGDATLAVAELPGIEAAISRTWSIDYEAIMASSPEAVDLNDWEGLSALNAQVMQFDSAENARGAWDLYREFVATGVQNLEQGGTPTVSGEEIDDLGEAAAATTLVTLADDIETHLRYVVVHNETSLLVVSALAGTGDNALAADAMARYILEEGAESEEPVVLDPAGFSEGGLWGLLPPSGHEVLNGLIPLRDDQLYPLPQVDA